MKRFTPLAACLIALSLLASGCGKTDRLSGTTAGDGSRAVQITPSGPMSAPAGIPSVTALLIAGRTIEMGAVHVWLDQGELCVQYATQPTWVLNATHLAVAAAIGDMPLNPAGNPRIGHFPYSQTHSPAVTQHTYRIDLAANDLENEPTLLIGAQADVSELDASGAVVRHEGAWADGESVDIVAESSKAGKGRGSWANFVSIDMRQLRGLLLWNKLGSQHEVQHSVVGPNGIITGSVTYLPCKHGSGFKALPRTGNHNVPGNFIDFPGLNLGRKGCIEFWYWPDWSNWQVGHIVETMYYGVPGAMYDIGMQYNDWQELQYVVAYTQVSLRPSVTPSWTTLEPFHVAFTWDGTQPIPANRVKLYHNGSPVGSTSTWIGSVTDWSPAAVLRLGSRITGGDWDRHPWEGDHWIMDNIKVWSFPKTDFSDRFQE
ncbi:MAG: hypothetical protein HZB25_08170 [Candidatus Eisenbacteria bacterium]|nr:hypothetical protein [Candidatus Eisenbacteria bacterium]